VPKLWNDTIDEHRRTVHTAILDATAELVARHGPASVTMSQIAQGAGIGRATLYKYFPDVNSIILAWHERQIGRHLRQLTEARDGAQGPGRQLEAVLHAYATVSGTRHGGAPAPTLHRREHVAHAERHLRDLVGEIITRAAAAGEVRTDVPPDELAGYCLHALGAAGDLRSKAAVSRLVAVTMAGLRSP
jgi:AcrR family transcriptional regulator